MISLIGLDLSLTSTGISVGGKTSVLATKSRGAERLHIISSEIIKICIDNDVQCAIIEGYSFASRNSQAHSIGELGGAVRMRLWESGIIFIDVPPTCRAKFATGKGNASKSEVVSSVSAKTGIVFSGSGGDDECDAWLLEEMALQHIGLAKHVWASANVSALDKVNWSHLDALIGENLGAQ
jgi:Holliday junction resolvasome RuvABC endonuclease subunit